MREGKQTMRDGLREKGRRRMGSHNGISRRAFISGAAVAGLSLTALGQLAGCGSGEGAGSAPGRRTLLFNDAPTSLDPAVGWDGWYTVCRGITETLVMFDKDMGIRECLATDWEMVDDTTWRFTIREGVNFQTGNPVTAGAVKSSLERSITLSTRAEKKIMLDYIETDENDVIIHTTQTIATMPGELAEPVFSIVDVTTVDDSPARSGTGPFMGKETGAMENFTLERFDGYWGGASPLAEVNMQTVTEPSARTIALQSGDADGAWSIQASDLATFENNDAYHVISSESVRMVFAFCNYLNKHLATKEFRQALSFATDRTGICENLLYGSLKQVGSLFPSYLSYSKNVEDAAQAYDPDRAKELLAQAGYTTDADGKLVLDGEKVTMRIAYYESRPELPIIAQALQDAYGKLGITVELQLYENIDDLFHTDQFDLMLYNTTTIGNGDPSYYLELYYLSDGSENAGGYSNPAVDAIVSAMRAELDEEERHKMAEEAERIILEDCPNIFIGSPVMNAVTASEVTGIDIYPVEYYGVTSKLS